jgi:hypothetical protein
MISRIAVASVHLIAMKPKFKSRKLELLKVYQESFYQSRIKTGLGQG